MSLWTSEEISQALQIDASGVPDIYGVSIDTRTLEPGDLFIALKGEKSNGHAYVQLAFDRGAAAVIISDANFAGKGPTILMPDTQAAMVQMAKFRRSQVNGKIVALTGSVGKTTTKDWLGQVCSKFGKTSFSVQSYNNYLGVPLSLTRMPRDTQYGIFEIGMNHPGEIEPLSQLVGPHIAVITAIGEAHVGNMISLEGIVEEKASIISGLQLGGILVLNRDSGHFDYLSDIAKTKGVHYVYGFGEDPRADVRLMASEGSGNISQVRAEVMGEDFTYSIPAPGHHSVVNSLAIVTIARILQFDLAKVVEILQDLKPLPGRGAQYRLTIDGKKVILIDDAYNANPTSMRAGLSVLSQQSGRKIAVLGEMGELGEQGPSFHEALGESVHKAGVDLVFASGELMQHLYTKLPEGNLGAYKPTAAELVEPVMAAIQDGDNIFIKGSKASEVSRVVQALISQADNQQKSGQGTVNGQSNG